MSAIIRTPWDSTVNKDLLKRKSKLRDTEKREWRRISYKKARFHRAHP